MPFATSRYFAPEQGWRWGALAQYRTAGGIELQAALNPPGAERLDKFGWTFCPKDKVMQIENDYEKEVYNGDIGFVT
jgi:hypothetical protein